MFTRQFYAHYKKLYFDSCFFFFIHKEKGLYEGRIDFVKNLTFSFLPLKWENDITTFSFNTRHQEATSHPKEQIKWIASRIAIKRLDNNNIQRPATMLWNLRQLANKVIAKISEKWRSLRQDFKRHFLVNTFCLLSLQTEAGPLLELCKSSVL